MAWIQAIQQTLHKIKMMATEFTIADMHQELTSKFPTVTKMLQYTETAAHALKIVKYNTAYSTALSCEYVYS